ncbi:Obg-like ATPase 1 [Tetrabaena socialis]|uniref:Obg-like ATPase 1 n=1 Tax=Tetrabaena socialis TaxID=47790 RepID=A0A2J7ZVW1_9CHLO|nr:Obg-like ATPase 1 [Tetrabaena socialis]|eukprot:PNH04411.1 Obg-like ATPase 1 [Tetrabaena socialis]
MPPKADKGKEGETKGGAARFGRVRNSLRMGIVGLPNVGKSSLFNLLTEQPLMGLSRHARDASRASDAEPVEPSDTGEHGGGVLIPFSVEWEAKLWATRDDPDARQAFLDGSSGVVSAMPKMVVQGFKELNLGYFFTAGETEVRCWTIQKGTLAPQAAGVIHTDFERGFIKAEVVAYEDFRALATGRGMGEVKAAGKYRQEGKSYVVEDGDIIHFQFNVTTSAKK